MDSGQYDHLIHQNLLRSYVIEFDITHIAFPLYTKS